MLVIFILISKKLNESSELIKIIIQFDKVGHLERKKEGVRARSLRKNLTEEKTINNVKINSLF